MMRRVLVRLALNALLLAPGVVLAQAAGKPAAAPAAALKPAAAARPATAPLKTAPAKAAPAVAAGAGAMKKGASVEGITEYSLDNGLRVLFFPDSSKPTATVNITYLVGSRQEGYGETGMAHLLEHMVFKGSTGHKDIPQELTAHGARPNGSTWVDRTNYFETFAAGDENLQWALDLEADRMVNSFIARKDLDSEMTVVRNEFESGENDPQNVLIERLMSTAYLWHNYGKSTIGSRADIERVPIDRLQAFYRKWYQPDDAVLVVAGKFDEAKTMRWIVEKFGRIPRPERKIEDTYTVEPAQDGPRQVTLRRVGDLQVVALGYHVPAGSHSDFAAIDVLSYLLGDEPSGRLYKSLVETQKASSVASFAWQFKEPGLLMAMAEVRKDKPVDVVRDELIRALETFSQTAPTDKEVERARTALLKNWETTMRSSERAALSLSEWASRGDWRLVFVHRDRLEQVKPEDVTRVAAAYLKVNNRTLGVFEPTAAAERVEIPETPNIAALTKTYKGRAAMQEGEAFDPAPAAIEKRLERSNVGGLKATLLPKQTRGATAQVAVTLRLGDENTLKGRAPAGEMLSEMLMRGTTKRSRQEIQDELDRLKTQLRLSGGPSQLTATFETTHENVVPALRLLGEILRQPAFPASELELLRQEQLARVEEAKSDPTQKAFTAFSRHQDPWPADDPRYTATPDEDVANLKALKTEDVKAFYGDFVGASAGEVAVVGDFDKAEVVKVLAEVFTGWQNPKPFTRLPGRYLDVAPTFDKLEAPDKENAFFIAGENIAIQDNDPDYPAMVLGNFMLGGGFLNSRLATRIRRTEGLSYGVGSQFQASAFEPSATWGAFAIYAPQNADKLVAAFKDELQKALDKGFTADELAEAKKGWLQSRSVSRSQDRELVRNLATRSFQGRTLAFDSELESKVDKLTLDEVLQALKRHLDPAKLTMVLAGDFAKAAKTGGK